MTKYWHPWHTLSADTQALIAWLIVFGSIGLTVGLVAAVAKGACRLLGDC